MIRKVHVVCKTHLDIGFTDLADSVIDHYIHRYLPGAIRLAQEVNPPGQPKRFVWTVGAYLIDEALRRLSGPSRAALDDAVGRGWIAYHAMPYTTHSELCDERLFDAGLGIFRRLDARYGRRTIAAKMSDVPGHTLGIVEPLARHGVRFLHIGINDVACRARVPALFRWDNGRGDALVVNYTRGYGGVTVLPGHDEALCVLHTNDNMGPPSPERLAAEMQRLQALYPDAEVTASTLDAFARGMLGQEHLLPEIRDEIGDTWIHGVGTDPGKTRRLRQLSRLCDTWDAQGVWSDLPTRQDGRTSRQAFLEELLLVCEHTWGLDTKKYLTDYRNWNRADFDRAREADRLLDAYAQVPGYEDCFAFARNEFCALAPDHIRWEDRSYSLFESSHAEQRRYLDRAVALLPPPMQKQAEGLLQGETGDPEFPPDLQSPPRQEGESVWVFGGFRVAWTQGHTLQVSARGVDLSFGLPIYQETGQHAFSRLMHDYLEHIETHRAWAIPDNGKPGLEFSDAPVEDVHHRPWLLADPCLTGDGRLCFTFAFPEGPQKTAGCPATCRIEIWQTRGKALLLSLTWAGKAANRKPEALFWPLARDEGNTLSIQKIGAWIDPWQVVPYGNARVHGAQALRLAGATGVLRLSLLDTPLLVVGAPELLHFVPEPGAKRLHLNLYNNLWGTNFPMWYGQDMTCRFLLTEERGDIP